MRNNEYREKLVAKIHDAMFYELRTAAQKELDEYDRLHPETIQVKRVAISDSDCISTMKIDTEVGWVTVFDNVNSCKVNVIDNTLNVEIE